MYAMGHNHLGYKLYLYIYGNKFGILWFWLGKETSFLDVFLYNNNGRQYILSFLYAHNNNLNKIRAYTKNSCTYIPSINVPFYE